MRVRIAVVVVGALTAANPTARPLFGHAREVAVQVQPGPDAGARSEGGSSPIEKVADNLYVIRGRSGSTAMFVAASGVVLVDPTTPENGQTVFNMVRSVTDKRITHVIYTHAHVYNAQFDTTSAHIAGDVSAAEFPATVTIIAHENTAVALKKVKAAWQPDQTFKKKLTVLTGRDAIDLYHFGWAHTDGDMFVVFRKLRVMHAGDVFAAKGLPFIDRANGGSGILFPNTIQSAVRAITGVDSVIAHRTRSPSAALTWRDFVDYGEFNDRLLSHAVDVVRNGTDAQQPTKGLVLPEKFKSYDFTGARGDGPRVHISGLVDELKLAAQKPSQPREMSDFEKRLRCLVLACG